ncbi:hypothetical protein CHINAEXTREME_01145 [Halobiforma lacisalsi AJ5]|uniref:Uncharacterized protein n=1 Tax=Natronobacterium lacisalsi AJ5 TaxID=358396 RepID=A0A1P8LKY9_NATLA|nr:hypothetical protein CHINAEXTREME_01145 [Halobiforma lacisalsi AJ5]
MRVVLNESTQTIHKPARSNRQSTACGALRHVSPARIRETTRRVPDSATDDDTYCGRCFDVGSGY